jgi:hypothetical protein
MAETAIFRSGVDHLKCGGQCIAVRKIAQEVAVRFVRCAGSVETREGPVPVAPGDAVITGSGGEQWPVAEERFLRKYEPADATALLEDGKYRSLPLEALARKSDTAFQVLLADGATVLQGQAGDWLLDYRDGTLGVVAQTLFPGLYVVIGN